MNLIPRTSAYMLFAGSRLIELRRLNPSWNSIQIENSVQNEWNSMNSKKKQIYIDLEILDEKRYEAQLKFFHELEKSSCGIMPNYKQYA